MTRFEQQTLHVLFCLSRDNQRTSADALAAALNATPTQAAQALVALEAAGLVDASRARLTMVGLATAVRRGPALGGALGGPRRTVAVAEQLPTRLPIAAQPSL